MVGSCLAGPRLIDRLQLRTALGELGQLFLAGDLVAVLVLIPETLPEFDPRAKGSGGQVLQGPDRVVHEPPLFHLHDLDQQGNTVPVAHLAQGCNGAGAHLPGIIHQQLPCGGAHLIRIHLCQPVKRGATHRYFLVLAERNQIGNELRLIQGHQGHQGAPTHLPGTVCEALAHRNSIVAQGTEGQHAQDPQTHGLFLAAGQEFDDRGLASGICQARQNPHPSCHDLGILVPQDGFQHTHHLGIGLGFQGQHRFHPGSGVLVLAEVLFELPQEIIPGTDRLQGTDCGSLESLFTTRKAGSKGQEQQPQRQDQSPRGPASESAPTILRK